ncbi:MAG TPA: hypothetical protein PKW90_09630 [Myxococcota bacterium]|nr:hypothetical protein [Myxococcota bacterium]
MSAPWLSELDHVDAARLVDLLERIHREGVEVTPELAARELSHLGEQRSREDLYATALDHFSKEEQRLRVQSEVTRGLLQKLRERQSSSPQQRLLRLVAAPHQPFLGRFRVENTGRKQEPVSFEPRFSEPCTFHPPHLTLEASEAALVSLHVPTGLGPGEHRDLLVDVRVGGALRLKLWVELCADAS